MRTNKHCPRCQETLPIERFPRNAHHRDGFASYCKPCEKARRDEAKRNAPPCSIEECGGTSVYGGLCLMHYRRKLRGKDLNAPRFFQRDYSAMLGEAAIAYRDAEDDEEFEAAKAALERTALRFSDWWKRRNRRSRAKAAA